ncbi:hypothetical protein SAMN05661008_00139 [Alkalithermobacter thermoalcaliphilus JW-YL-7 = DSM 7308]|uniref:Uncharacterized protein n=1 Tax=Alkalithermobacter thermoalcaliphilus JW-YL-7 = DSM 7308 TaxID=1121328 RepID=A0A150FRR1_CLOPD|nr:hypothetical protein JWYL7_1382 [[Clostridium] paradoxum JW-YL-7 = DSM 7308]SHK38677.1 hypothetical protein SAMN05661008_00139 [[Clostridium] paradoxum JW-YL-7 = DSM 7308]
MYNYYYDNYLNYCMKRYKDMCPQLYHKVQRITVRVCQEDDRNMYVFPNEDVVENMVDRIYECYTNENKTRDDEVDLDEEYRSRRGILRDFMRFILLRNLVDRRCRYFGRRCYYY